MYTKGKWTHAFSCCCRHGLPLTNENRMRKRERKREKWSAQQHLSNKYQMFFCRLRFKWICYDSFFFAQNFCIVLFSVNTHLCFWNMTKNARLPKAREKKQQKQHMYAKRDTFSSSVSCYICIKLYKFRCFSSRLETQCIRFLQHSFKFQSLM